MMNNTFYEYIKLFHNYEKKTKRYKNIVLYGWSWNNGGGTYLEWIFQKYYDLEFDFIIDDNEVSYGKKIYRKNLLDYLDASDTLIISSVDVYVEVREFGYQENENYFYVNKDLGVKNIGYYEFIEKEYGLDLIDRRTTIRIKDVCKDGSDYAVSRGIGMPLLCEYISEHYPNQNVLDIGCGKGAAMILLKEFGYQHVDGLEYLDELCTVARRNFEKYKINDSKVFCVDATKFNKYEDYDMFYLYDPFQGSTLLNTVIKIQDSYKNKPRRIVMVYANPWCHRLIVDNSDFKLVKQIDGDWFTRMTNIYELGSD